MASTPAGKPLNPERLDVQALAERGQAEQGQWSLTALQRLCEPGEPIPDDPAPVQWQARAEYRPVRGGAPELWLHLDAQASVQRTCQRCLQPVTLQLPVQRDFLFAPTEEQAEAWDAERDDADVLVLTRALNLRELVEDELLLALPLVPRHESCPQPLVPLVDASEQSSLEPIKGDNPFAVLAQLRRPS
jgi:uncharacterized protein